MSEPQKQYEDAPEKEANNDDKNHDAAGYTEKAITVGGVAGERLKSLIERIECLEEEKAELLAYIKEVYGEAKGVGFDPKTIRKIVSLRKMDHEKRREAEELEALYKSAIGMV